MPEEIASVLHEENQEIYFTPSVESGPIGGNPLDGLTFGGLEVVINDRKLLPIQESLNKKFLKYVEHIMFSAKNALLANKNVTYVTEHAVFVLT